VGDLGGGGLTTAPLATNRHCATTTTTRPGSTLLNGTDLGVDVAADLLKPAAAPPPTPSTTRGGAVAANCAAEPVDCRARARSRSKPSSNKQQAASAPLCAMGYGLWDCLCLAASSSPVPLRRWMHVWMGCSEIHNPKAAAGTCRGGELKTILAPP
jgi:hypothetical protein